VFRLPAYRGVLRQRLLEQQEDGKGRSPKRASRQGNVTQRTNNPRLAATAPPATAATFAELNASLGQQWFSHRVVKAGESQ
jgi:hypothetical protein